MRTRRRLLLPLLFLTPATLTPAALAQQQQPPPVQLPPSVLPDRPPEAGGDLLGDKYESQSAGLSLRLPAGMKELQGGANGADIVAQFVNESRGWVLQIQQLKLPAPAPLTSDDPGKPGLLETTAKRLTTTLINPQVLRQDTTNTADAAVGMIAVRYTAGTARKLSQEALVRSSDDLYYVLDFTTPAGKPDGDSAAAPGAAPAPTPDEKLAVDTFSALIDTVQFTGEKQQEFRAEQDQRLFHSLALFVNVNRKSMEAAIVPERWFRVVRDGHDVGYSFITESLANQGNRDGVAVAIETVTFPQPRARLVSHANLFVSFDRRHEEWATSAALRTPGSVAPQVAEEIGISDRRTKFVTPPKPANPLAPPPGLHDPAKPPPAAPTPSEVYDLTVTYSHAATAPLHLDFLPPFYIQQAFGHLLPRLLPKSPDTYLFATYVPDRRQVMMRYVDVLPEREVAFAGRKFTAISVKDRIGYRGPVTTHYLSPDGQYLGSISEASKTALVPSDKKTVDHIFQTLAPAEPTPAARPQTPVTPQPPTGR